MATNYTLVDAGPATVVDSKTKETKQNTYEIQAGGVNPADYPHLATKLVKTAKGPKTVAVLEIPATDLKVPSYTTREAFLADAAEFKQDGDAKAMECVNAVLNNTARTVRNGLGNSAKVIPANAADIFATVPEQTVKAFWEGVRAGESAKTQLANVRNVLVEVDMNDMEAMKRALEAARAALKF